MLATQDVDVVWAPFNIVFYGFDLANWPSASMVVVPLCLNAFRILPYPKA
jgi:hypothetical protein